MVTEYQRLNHEMNALKCVSLAAQQLSIRFSSQTNKILKNYSHTGPDTRNQNIETLTLTICLLLNGRKNKGHKSSLNSHEYNADMQTITIVHSSKNMEQLKKAKIGK